MTSLYPSATRPNHGIFVENRLRHLTKHCAVSPRVVAPFAWCPIAPRATQDYSNHTATPPTAQRHGIKIDHPAYPMVPMIGMAAQPYLYYRALKRHVVRLIDEEGPFDLIDCHYMYPDGVACALLARALDLPLSITVRGTDINLIPKHALPRQWIRWAIKQADHLIAVCQALAHELIELGAAPDKLTVLRNGVDLELFRPDDRAQRRHQWQIEGPTLLTVGALIERKGIDLIIQAMQALPEHRLMIAGDGPLRTMLEGTAQRLGVAGRVRFLGSVPHSQLPSLYEAVDIFILASSREGWANVLLESMACGTPVAASNVWGTPEVVAGPQAGRLLTAREPASIASAVLKIEATKIDRGRTRAFAEQFSWDATSEGQYAIFRSIASREHRS